MKQTKLDLFNRVNVLCEANSELRRELAKMAKLCLKHIAEEELTEEECKDIANILFIYGRDLTEEERAFRDKYM